MVPIRTILAAAGAGIAAGLAAAPAAAAVPLDSHVITAGVGDILLGAGAATALMGGMVVVVALSWRSFRDAADGDADRDPFDWRDRDAKEAKED